MRQVSIRFTDAEQVRSFINIINTMEIEFDLGSEIRSVNAKSVLGILTLDLSKAQSLRYNSEDKEIYNKLKQFFV